MAIGSIMTARLSTGPWIIGSVGLDVGTLYISSTLIILGYQSVWFALISKAFGTREGLLPVNTKFEEAKERFSLERIAKASSVLAMLGLVAIAGAFSRWGSEGFGAQDMRSLLQLLIPAMTSVVLAAQSLLSRMVLSAMEIPSKSVVG